MVLFNTSLLFFKMKAFLFQSLTNMIIYSKQLTKRRQTSLNQVHKNPILFSDHLLMINFRRSSLKNANVGKLGKILTHCLRQLFLCQKIYWSRGQFFLALARQFRVTLREDVTLKTVSRFKSNF